MILKRYSIAPAFSLTLIALYGCGPGAAPPVVPAMTAGDDHDHGHEHGADHDHHEEHEHESLAGALTELTKLRDTIRDGFAKKDSEEAHEPLHEVGHVLEEIPELAEKEKLSAEAITAIKAAVEELFVAFGDVDKGLHGQQGVKYADVSSKVDAAVAAILAAAKPVAATDATTPPATEPTPADAPPAAAEPAPPATEPQAAPPTDPAASGSGS